jgi:O-antigen/teichoic acid export membrane protein
MIDTTARRRIWGTLAGNTFVRLMRIAEQLLLVPVFLAVWGVERYGEWIALNAIATFVTLGNFGIAHAGLSDIVLRYAGGNKRQAARSFVTSMVLLTFVITCAYLLVIAALSVFDLGSVVSLQTLSVAEARSVILLVTLSTLLFFYGEPLNGVISASIGSAVPSLLFSISKAVELIGTAAALLYSASPVTVAVVVLGCTILNLAMNFAVALKYAPWISLSIRDFDIEALRRTWKASLSFFALLIFTTVFAGQVPRLIVFHFFGGAVVASFSILVIYTRAARLLALTMSQATQVEIGRAFAHGRLDQVKGLVETILGSAIGIAGVILIAEFLLAPIVIPAWTHGHVAVSWDVLIALGIVAFVGAYFDAAMVAVAAFNRVGLVALIYGAGLAVGLPASLAGLPYLGPAAIAIGLILPELGGSCAALKTLREALPSFPISPIPRSLWPKSLMRKGDADGVWRG